MIFSSTKVNTNVVVINDDMSFGAIVCDAKDDAMLVMEHRTFLIV